MSYQRIDVAQAIQLIDEQEARIVDIRDEEAFGSGHIPAAVHIHNANIADFIQDADPDKPLIVCCYHGNMSQGAAAYFAEQGFAETYSLDGGYEAWAGYQTG